MSTAITQIEQAVSFLSGRCDGAHSLDHKGFNGRDTKFGKSLAGQIAAGRKLSAAQLQAALKMLRTYEKSQLVPAGHSLPDAATLSAELQARQTPAKAPKTGYDLIDHGAYIEVKWPYDQKDRYLPALKKTVPAQDMHFSRQTASWSIAPKHKTALSKALSAA
jgi:hypothetical protein